MENAIKKYWPVFLLPTLAAFVIGFIWPFIWGIYLSFHKFITGQCIEAVILGALCAIGMAILRLPYATMIGALVGVVFAVVSVILCRSILTWMHTPADMMEHAYAYLVVLLGAIPLTLFYNLH